jgi:hypothetical protein
MEIAMDYYDDENYLSNATAWVKLSGEHSKSLEESSGEVAVAQVRAIQAVAVALDRLARAVEQLQR